MAGANRSTPAASTTTVLGFCLLPSELLQEILFRLALPEVHRLRCACRTLAGLIASEDFRRLYHLRAAGAGGGWVFLFKKRPPRDAVLRGFNDQSGSWFRFPLPASALMVDDLYFLAASGNFFLFASNLRRDLVAVNLASSTSRRLPLCPLGPRGTSFWRRSGLKLTADPPGSNHFRFLFAEIHDGRPILFEYRSETDTWNSSEAAEPAENHRIDKTPGLNTYLTAAQYGRESLMICAGPDAEVPTVFRPRISDPLAINVLYVYGDGNVVIVRSSPADDGTTRSRFRVVTSVELLGISSDGTSWALTSKAPTTVIEGIKRPFGALIGCVSEREGTVRVVLVSTCRGNWDLAWLSYDRSTSLWRWVPVPDSGTKGLNLAGVALSSTFSRLWPPSRSSFASGPPPSTFF